MKANWFALAVSFGIFGTVAGASADCKGVPNKVRVDRSGRVYVGVPSISNEIALCDLSSGASCQGTLSTIQAAFLAQRELYIRYGTQGNFDCAQVAASPLAYAYLWMW